MTNVSEREFGLLVAYVLPGFIALWGVGQILEPVHLWLAGPMDAGPTISGFFYVVLGSIAAGMTVSAIRWAVVDSIHHRTGLRKPAWDDGALEQRLNAYQLLIEIHYRYYQFYANVLVALPFSYILWRFSSSARHAANVGVDLGVLFIELVFIAASRDALSKYYRRTERLLGSQKRKSPMTNGGHHQDPIRVSKPLPHKAPSAHVKDVEQTNLAGASSMGAATNPDASTGVGDPVRDRK